MDKTDLQCKQSTGFQLRDEPVFDWLALISELRSHSLTFKGVLVC